MKQLPVWCDKCKRFWFTCSGTTLMYNIDDYIVCEKRIYQIQKKNLKILNEKNDIAYAFHREHTEKEK